MVMRCVFNVGTASKERSIVSVALKGEKSMIGKGTEGEAEG